MEGSSGPINPEREGLVAPLVLLVVATEYHDLIGVDLYATAHGHELHPPETTQGEAVPLCSVLRGCVDLYPRGNLEGGVYSPQFYYTTIECTYSRRCYSLA
jgi:hypothetical protein